MTTEVFLDSGFAIALASDTDALHDAAVKLLARVRTENRQFVTTRAILMEIGNGLSKRHFRNSAIELLNSIEADPQFTILAFTEQLYVEARQLFANRLDKDWGMTDCMSFVAMQQRGIAEALTHDSHFQQAGFRALLREELST